MLATTTKARIATILLGFLIARYKISRRIASKISPNRIAVAFINDCPNALSSLYAPKAKSNDVGQIEMTKTIMDRIAAMILSLDFFQPTEESVVSTLVIEAEVIC